LLALCPKTYWDFGEPSAGKHTNEFVRIIDNALKTGDWSNFRMPPTEFGLRGGDFLPGFKKFEVEIARLSLNSTTWDVTSIRARPSNKGIVYRVVDEYESNYEIRPKSSRKPLSLGQLIQLIDGMKVDGEPASPASHLDSQDVNSKEAINQAKSFVIVSSDFYPDLQTWYERETTRWMETRLDQLPDRLKKEQQILKAETEKLEAGANENSPAALTSLGHRHFVGLGVERSREKAVALWRRAADLGDATGTLNLAVCLHDGLGVHRDQERALELYEHLAANGYYVGLKMAAFCRHTGVGCKPDLLKALRWYFEIAKGFGPTRFADDLVRCLRNSDGKSELEQEAISWIRNASQIGSAGQNMLKSLCEGRTDDPYPVKHDAGVGYLGDTPLMRFGSAEE
jgi:hypothetical protein